MSRPQRLTAVLALDLALVAGLVLELLVAGAALGHALALIARVVNRLRCPR